MIRHYSDAAGRYLGAFADCAPPLGATERPAAPHERAQWTDAGWAVPDEVLAVDLAELRASAVLPKLEFCLALWRLSILPKDECKAAARGEWPATFAAFVAGLSEQDATEAEIRWAAATQILYTNPLLQALALFKAGGDRVQAAAFLDAIFGVRV
jgi:hypothetical protein